ncbi:TetR family transcriptional regulator [Nonomuraea rubra]|uniref:TetR family transcriptional regulator n=1 Tax=Nonomuraea rubra TaxID=46180 RepID=UPI00360EE371
MTRSAFLRARRPEHKQQRREAILAAARELARASGVRNVSLGAVAEAVGLAKSNIVRYFGTREEIYLELLIEEWGQWAEAASDRLRTAGSAEAAVTVLAETVCDRPLFCDLLSHTSTSLEHNVSVPAARAFKHAVHDRLAEMGVAIAAVTDLTEREEASWPPPPAAWPACSIRRPTRRPRSPRCTPRTPSWRRPAPCCCPRSSARSEPSRPACPRSGTSESFTPLQAFLTVRPRLPVHRGGFRRPCARYLTG